MQGLNNNFGERSEKYPFQPLVFNKQHYCCYLSSVWGRREEKVLFLLHIYFPLPAKSEASEAKKPLLLVFAHQHHVQSWRSVGTTPPDTGGDCWSVLCTARSWTLMIPVCPFQSRIFCDHQHISEAELVSQTVQAELFKYSFKLVFMPLLLLAKSQQCMPQRQEFIPIARARSAAGIQARTPRPSPPCSSEERAHGGRHGTSCSQPFMVTTDTCCPSQRNIRSSSFFHHSISPWLVSHANIQRVFNSKSPQVTSVAKFPGQINYL